MRKLIVLVLAGIPLIVTGCSEDSYSKLDNRQLTGGQVHSVVRSFEGKPFGVVVNKNGEFYEFGTGIENFNPDEFTGALREGVGGTSTIEEAVRGNEKFVSRLIRSVDEKEVIGVYLTLVDSGVLEANNMGHPITVNGLSSIMLLLVLILMFRGSSKSRLES